MWSILNLICNMYAHNQADAGANAPFFFKNNERLLILPPLSIVECAEHFFVINNFPPICTVHNGKSHHMFLHSFACRKCPTINTHIVNETQQ